MVASLDELADALVVQWQRVPAIQTATRDTDDTMANLPGVLVYEPSMQLMERPPMQEYWDWVWPCVLVVESPAGKGFAKTALDLLVFDCLQAFWNGYGLGLEYVVDCWIGSARPTQEQAGEGPMPAYQFDVTTRLHWSITRNKTFVP